MSYITALMFPAFGAVLFIVLFLVAGYFARLLVEAFRSD